MLWSKEKPSKYLKAADLDGEIWTVTIKAITKETFDAEGEKILCHFVEHDKPLVLNQTNGNTLAQLFGDETSNWRGPVELQAVDVDYKGSRVQGLRIGRVRRSKSQPEPPPTMPPSRKNGAINDDIPF